MNDMLDKAKSILFTISGHAVTGFTTAFLFELMQRLQSGVTDWKIMFSGALLCGCIGFLKTLVTEIQDHMNSPIASSTPKGRKIIVPEEKKFKQYFGF